MKKVVLSFLLILPCVFLFSQQPSYPKVLVPQPLPDLAPNIDEESYLLPPINNTGYHLTDSITYYRWNTDLSEWEMNFKRYFINDCEIGLPTEILSKGYNSDQHELFNHSKIERDYFGEGSDREEKWYTWDDDSLDWIPSYYSLWKAPDLLVERWSKNWDPILNKVDGGSKILKYYDDNDNLVLDETYFWEEDIMDFELRGEISFEYNDDNNVVLRYSEWFNYNINMIEPADRFFYSYNNDGLLSEEIKEEYEMSLWIPATKINYSYDSVGRITQRLTYEYEEISESFEFKYRHTSNYADNGSYEESLWQRYNNGQWENLANELIYYYPDGKMESKEKYVWSANQNQWIMDAQELLDEEGNHLFGFFKRFFNDFNGTFEHGSKYGAIYSDDNLLESSTWQTLVTNTYDDWVNSNRRTYTYEAPFEVFEELWEKWDETEGQWYNNSKLIYHNTGCLFNSTSENEIKTQPCVHPNPITFGQQINCSDLPFTDNCFLELFSITGVLMHSQKINDKEISVDKKNLTSGLYILSIRSENEIIYREKVILIE